MLDNRIKPWLGRNVFQRKVPCPHSPPKNDFSTNYFHWIKPCVFSLRCRESRPSIAKKTTQFDCVFILMSPKCIHLTFIFLYFKNSVTSNIGLEGKIKLSNITAKTDRIRENVPAGIFCRSVRLFSTGKLAYKNEIPLLNLLVKFFCKQSVFGARVTDC